MRINGVVSGIVKELNDPQGEGRILVEFPWMGGKNNSYYAPPATLMAGGGRGSWFMPEIGDEVLVAFDQGDVNHPYIVGFMWNGASKPPSTDPHLRLLQSVNGHSIAFYDPAASGGDVGYLRISDAYGNVIQLSNGQIAITGIASISINAPLVTINKRVVAPTPNPI